MTIADEAQELVLLRRPEPLLLLHNPFGVPF
ncbi:rCG41780, isoform CRA_b, partial [Rattus norvegicus]